ncbi:MULTISPECIES: IS481 family transposase [Mycobacteriaceae]|uniref:IS481 family transposase n=1 Tax=Mycobacteriaceae TaxID=1762 RepID=UPI000DCBF17E|nr:IS481 family transposase [Mycolicibacter senuensis]RAU89721.1 IS481 family transposase [Mycolicibacter senuensis]
MSKARLVITAVVEQGLSQSEAARTYRVSQSWISKLVRRYRLEGEAAFEPRSRRPHHSPTRLAQATIDVIIRLRAELAGKGLDHGPQTIAWHLQHHHHLTVAPNTIHRHLRAAGLIPPQPQKRPKSSYIRFAAEQPNERWQADFTHWRLADGTDTEILDFIDDHARYLLRLTAHRRVTGTIVVTEFRNAVEQHGIPYSTLTDNGMVFTTRLAGGKGGRNAFESELRTLGVRQINSTPSHPTTCGKIERFHRTLKKWLQARPRATTLTELQTQLDTFTETYNQHRPHSALQHRATPSTAYNARPKANPANRTDTHDRVRTDRIDKSGTITLRVHGRLHHIGLGRTHAGTRVLILAQDHDITIINAATGELLRQLTLDPTRDYQPRHVTRGRPKKKSEP